MSLNVTYPSSANVGFFIDLDWSNTYGDSYFTVGRQINNNTTWQGAPFPVGSDLTRYSEQAEATWERVRYRVSGFPSGTISTTNWITVEGGVDPDPGGGDPGDPIEPDPILTTPNILVPERVAPQTSFEVHWSDSNVDATYELEEEVNNGI